METQSRWKSPVLWTAIGAQVVSILLLAGLIGSEQVEILNNIIAGVLQILVFVGIFNSPTSKDTW